MLKEQLVHRVYKVEQDLKVFKEPKVLQVHKVYKVQMVTLEVLHLIMILKQIQI